MVTEKALYVHIDVPSKSRREENEDLGSSVILYMLLLVFLALIVSYLNCLPKKSPGRFTASISLVSSDHLLQMGRVTASHISDF